MEKYFKIGEISALYNVGADSIRYYEKMGVITPKRTEKGYRLYSINDIWRLNVIRELLELGFNMQKIKEYLNCHNLESTEELLKSEENAINLKIKSLQNLKKNVLKRMENITNAQKLPLNTITLKTQQDRKYFNIPEGYSEEHEMDILIKKLVNIDKSHFYVIGNNQIGTVIPLKTVKEEGRLKYESVFIIDEKGNKTLKGGKYLSVSYKGNYSQSEKWINELILYAKKNSLKLLGDVLELLWIDIHSSSDINEHITELQIKVE